MLDELATRTPPGVRVSPDGRIAATYVLQGGGSLEEAAEAVAIEESTGLAQDLVPSAAHRRVAGEVTDVHVEGSVPPVLPSAPLRRMGVQSSEVGTTRIAWPCANVTSIPALLTMVLGEANETGTFGVCRLVGLELPDETIRLFPGPAHGVEGARSASGVSDRPLVGAIVKPSTGLTAHEHAAIAVELAEGGADFVKDDELLMDPGYCRLEDRISTLPGRLAGVAERRGRPALYAPNVTGPVHEMRARVLAVESAGCGMVMANVLAVGLDAFAHAVRDAGIPVFGHRVMSGALTRALAVGVSSDVLCGLTRLCGADLVQVGSIGGKIFEEDDIVLRNAEACLTRIPGVRAAMPVSGGGQDASTVAATHAAFAGRDHCHLFGSGVFADPLGPRGGTAAALDAWVKACGSDG